MQDTEGIIHSVSGDEARAIIGASTTTDNPNAVRLSAAVGFDPNTHEEVFRTIEITIPQAINLIERQIFERQGYGGSRNIIEELVAGKYDSPAKAS